MAATSQDLQTIGSGITVFEDVEVVSGPTIWLGSPDAVLDFVERDDTGDFVIVARGGTTTFLTPAMLAGVRGIITLQGAPTSHLGIISREYGIPCLMSVSFTAGDVNERGEVIPPDGTQVALDISSPKGRVLLGEGQALNPAPVIESSQDPSPTGPATFVKTGVVGGSEGNRLMLSRMRTDVVNLSDESLTRELTAAEVNDIQDYYGWNVWDILAARITEGESGLIPRQEYEVLGVYVQWRKHPEWHRMITDKVGVDGLRQIGAIARREVGTKVNPLHIWAAGLPTAQGRGIAVELGIHAPEEHTQDLAGAIQFTRRLYRGMWADNGAMFTAARGYTAAILDDDVLERFIADKRPVEDPEQRRGFQRFNGSTGITSFLLHFDNRCGVADSGPYSLPDGGWALVRDHVLHDAEYPWADATGDLPYAVTQVMFFEGPDDIAKSLVDIGTLFTEPANYLRHLTGYAVYVKETETTPMGELRLMSDEELAYLAGRAETAASRLYPRIAAMSDREKILAGARVYYTDFIGPVAKAAGMWDELVATGFYDIEDAVDEVYETITAPGRAVDILGRHWGAGAGFTHIDLPR